MIVHYFQSFLLKYPGWAPFLAACDVFIIVVFASLFVYGLIALIDLFHAIVMYFRIKTDSEKISYERKNFSQYR